MKQFADYVLFNLDNRSELHAQVIVDTQQAGRGGADPAKHQVGLALIARHRGEDAAFLAHMERAAVLSPDDETVQQLLAQARG